MHKAITILLAALLSLAGCAADVHRSLQPTSQSVALAKSSGLVAPEQNTVVKAVVVPPRDWKPEPLKSSAKHKHQIWLSPSGDTAYGVIYFTMPWPVGPDLALWGFLDNMKRTEGQATLISKQADPNLPGLRFEAQGKRYDVRANMTIEGMKGWAVYAGTIIGKPIQNVELNLAIQAREQTQVGLP